MQLQETPEDLAFRAEVRAFVETNLPEDIRDRVLGFRRVERDDYVRWQKILHGRGWGAPGWPKEYGGTAWNARQRTIFEEECFTAGAPRQMPFGLSMVAPVIIAFGTAEQQARHLPKIISMDEWWCQGYSEPNAGSDLASLRTEAVIDGDDFVINGQKIWTTWGHDATHMFMLVRTDKTVKNQQGISFVLVDMKTPGITVRPIVDIAGNEEFCEVFFDDVRVPRTNLVGELNQGWTVAKSLLGFERLFVADGAAFSSLPAKNITFTLMANAVRNAHASS